MIFVIHKQRDRSDRDRDWDDRELFHSRYRDDDRKWQDSRQEEPTNVVILHGLDKDFKEEDVSWLC